MGKEDGEEEKKEEWKENEAERQRNQLRAEAEKANAWKHSWLPQDYGVRGRRSFVF